MTTTPTSHSELPPSSSDKWLVCHGWRQINLTIAHKPSSEAAKEGTEAHEVLSEVILGKKKLEDIEDEELFDSVALIHQIITNAKSLGVEVHSEIRVDFGKKFGFVDLEGTSDLVLVSEDRIEVLDFKYGKQLVEVDDNPQLLIYLVGAVEKFGPRSSYRLTIVQPRADHFKGPVRSFDLTPDYLAEFERKLETAITKSYKTPKDFVPGAHCRNYCNALAVCPAVRELVVKAFKSKE